MLPKEEMKKLLKGMSPDLTDNIILMCGGMIYDCHRMLRDDAGIMRKTMQAGDMLSFLGVNDERLEEEVKSRRRISVNNDWMLQTLSMI
jgi:hypothetical protein